MKMGLGVCVDKRSIVVSGEPKFEMILSLFIFFSLETKTCECWLARHGSCE